MAAPTPSPHPLRQPGLGLIIKEALFLSLAGLLLALLANALSPRGLVLTKDYFPQAALPAPQPSPAATNSAAVPTLAELLKAEGLQLALSNQVCRLFADPARTQGLIAFIDARDSEHFLQGHVPGAYLFDRFHPEVELGTVLEACQQARQIVVYCNGGDCDDSRFAAQILRDAGIPREKLFVYGGGLTEWATNGLPVELGERNSGRLQNR